MCIESWKKYLPDYEIKEWNEDNFNVNIIPYTKEAYKAKKYAFVSDYARFWILYNYGGLYFDTDVEVIKPMDDIIKEGPFMGCESSVEELSTSIRVAPGLGLGVDPRNGLYKELLDFYDGLSFYNENGSLNQVTIVQYTTDLLISKGLKEVNKIQEIEGVYIYPRDYFCPMDCYTGKLDITHNTRSIHHYTASWLSPSKKIERYIRLKFASLGLHHTGLIAKISNTLKKII